jgi:hypothetical protein
MRRGRLLVLSDRRVCGRSPRRLPQKLGEIGAHTASLDRLLEQRRRTQYCSNLQDKATAWGTD